jgi:uncharacterized protein YggT (Ycf19 family)
MVTGTQLTLIRLVEFAAFALYAVVFGHVIISYAYRALRPSKTRILSHPVLKWVDDVGFALLRPIRRFLEQRRVSFGPLDLSGIIFCMLVWVAEHLLISLIARGG